MTSQIAKFYARRSVFITGGSGFVGKQITEKLLRSCPQIDRIFLLMRAKDGQSAQQRLNQTLESPVFDVIKEKQPNFARKVVPVIGDVRSDFLGISDSDHGRLAANVSVVVHSAATLSFVEPLRVAVDMNVLGVQRTLDVCKHLPQLEALVHISTAYSQVDRIGQVIEETIYDSSISPEKIIAMTRTMTDDELAALVPHLLRQHKRPNTYTLTKAIAENLIQQQRGNIPVCIVRPSIIAASQAEPFPGWVDNFAAGNGVYAAFGTGTLRCILTRRPKGQTKIDIVPVDRVANAVIAAGWSTAVNRTTNAASELPVHNLISQGLHTLRLTTSLMLKNARRYPYSKLHPPRFSLTGFPGDTNNWLIHKYIGDVYLRTRFRLMDTILTLTGNKPRLMKIYEKTNILTEVLLFFTMNDFVWGTSRTMNIYDQMNDADKKMFNCKMDDMDIEKYYYDWWQGMKKYALKDPASLRQSEPLPENNMTNTVLDIRTKAM